MRITLSPFVVKLANQVAKIPGVKKILKPWYYRYKDRINQNRNKQFRENGIMVLESFDKIMTENDIPYTVFAGTLLGAVREKGFLAHDLDIDVAMFYDDRPDNLIDILKSGGFKLLHRFSIDNGVLGLEETYINNNVTLDIFYIYSEREDMTYQCDFHSELDSLTWEDSMIKYGYVKARRLNFPVSRNLIRLPFDRIAVSAIENYDKWLSCRYGDNYMIPDPNFSDKGDNPYIIDDWCRAEYQIY